jgi:hypothetical protein
MVFKPNYNMQRAERNRAKQAKKDEKLREKEEAAARRKAELESGIETPTADGSNTEDNDAA